MNEKMKEEKTKKLIKERLEAFIKDLKDMNIKDMSVVVAVDHSTGVEKQGTDGVVYSEKSVVVGGYGTEEDTAQLVCLILKRYPNLCDHMAKIMTQDMIGEALVILGGANTAKTSGKLTH